MVESAVVLKRNISEYIGTGRIADGVNYVLTISLLNPVMFVMQK